MQSNPAKVSPNQASRDLAWAVNSHSLIDDESILPWTLPEQKFDAEKLADFINERFTFPVGRYFEFLILFYLRHCLKVEVMAHGQQIQVDGRTVGELDFVFRDPGSTAVIHHVETAVKFYLHYSGDHDSGSHFVGPNPADNFESKLARLRDHQLPMSKQHAPDVTNRHPFVKGIVFYRPGEFPPTQLPPGMATNHSTGTWLHSNELHLLSEVAPTASTEIRFRLRRKPFWLSEDLLRLNHHETLTVDELRAILKTHFDSGGTPRMISVLSQSSECFTEMQRLFVVDECWPHPKPS